MFSTGMGDRISALLVSLMALRLALVDPNPLCPCLAIFLKFFTKTPYKKTNTSVDNVTDNMAENQSKNRAIKDTVICKSISNPIIHNIPE